VCGQGSSAIRRDLGSPSFYAYTPAAPTGSQSTDMLHAGLCTLRYSRPNYTKDAQCLWQLIAPTVAPFILRITSCVGSATVGPYHCCVPRNATRDDNNLYRPYRLRQWLLRGLEARDDNEAQVDRVLNFAS
jgi:hypothetical protein